MRSTLSCVVLALFVCAVFAAAASAADVPQLVNVQGLLTDSGDEPIADGTYSVSFSVYDVSVGGTALWSETRSVTTEDGLFTIILGETTPLSESIFITPDLWLGITVSGDTEMTPRQRLTSVPYALNAPGAGGVGSGWVADGSSVYLEDGNNRVGIGTDSPAWKLDVDGDINVSDSLIANKVRIGSASVEGGIGLYGPLTSGPYLEVGEHWDGGGDFFLNDATGHIAVTFQAMSTYGRSGSGWLNRNDGQIGIWLAGSTGNDNEPRLELRGTSRSIKFDMSESYNESVELPIGAISSSEMYNEPGVANSQTTSLSKVLDNTVQTIKSRTVSYPSDGYAVVIATAGLFIMHWGGAADNIFLGISDVSGSFPDHQNFVKYIDGGIPAAYFTDPITVHGYFPVTSGQHTFYFLGRKSSGGYTSINDVELTVLFFPTSYRWPLFPAPPNDGEQEGGAEQATPDEFKLIIAEQVKAETAAIRADYEAKLAQMKSDLTWQMQEMLKTNQAGR